jgi:hypothetical protein
MKHFINIRKNKWVNVVFYLYQKEKIALPYEKRHFKRIILLQHIYSNKYVTIIFYLEIASSIMSFIFSTGVESGIIILTVCKTGNPSIGQVLRVLFQKPKHKE